MQDGTQGDLVTSLGGLAVFGEQCLGKNRLQRLEMKPHRFSRRYPDWRCDGVRNDDLAGAESLAICGSSNAARIGEKSRPRSTRSSPPELLSAGVFDFGDTVMMVAREQRPGAKSYFDARMWVKRDARWQMRFSFNTRME